ncbi:MAG: hypothetical protein K2J78_13555 [Muribaculaceae bacterium]|nr:hypothetical protein [Muribaculaceae bacterium]MDE6770743.1 hypothetical protein [Muribaculaceae bacterium]
MKKILTLIMALCFLAPAFGQNYSKMTEKAQKKEVKEKMKEYKKKGYDIMGSRTMEVALVKHYSKLSDLGDNGTVFDGISTRTKSKSLGEQMALNDATLKYAQKAGSTVKGRVVSDNFADGTTGEGEFEKFYAAYERLIEQKVKHALEPSYSVIKDNGDGTYEIQSFFIVNESKARIAREQALEAALKESELAGKYGAQIRAYANDPIEQ